MTKTTAKMKVHPAAMLFPMIEGDAYSEFVEDIRKNGLQTPISVLPDGSVIDGRNRLRACEELGVKVDCVTVDPESPVQFVISANKHRRHLSSLQLAGLAADELPKFKAEAKERKREGGRAAGRGRPLQVGEQVSEPIDSGKARERAAKAFGTNAQYVQFAEQAKRDAPDVFEKIKSGEIKLAEARAEVAKRTGKRAQILENAAMQRAADFVGRIEGVPGYCEKVSVEAIRSDKRLHRHWKESCTSAIRALRTLIKRL